jgi:hypothetical protein
LPPTLAPDALQIEAVEPSTGPLHEQRASLGATPAAPLAGLADDNLRIFFLYEGGSPAAARATALSGSLAAAKDPLEVELRTVGFTIATPRIRYFHADDAEAAAALAAFLAPPESGGGPWQVQDFTHFRPLPLTGTLEVFVPSTGG